MQKKIINKFLTMRRIKAFLKSLLAGAFIGLVLGSVNVLFEKIFAIKI
jgi:hypothetical protein